MIYNYILEKFEYGEPIFFSELPGKSKDYLRQQIKKLVDNGNLERLYNGVYYLPYTTILGTKGRISIDKYIEKKYIQTNQETKGYIKNKTEQRFYSLISLPKEKTLSLRREAD